MPNGNATSETSRASAGRTSPYPKTSSRSHHSRSRARRPTPGAPAASRTRGPTAISAAGGLELALDSERHLLLSPLHGAFGRHAVDRLGHHVGQRVVDLDAPHRVVGLGRPAPRMRVL